MAKDYKIKLAIITGLSGAGKSEALRYFEDAGYYCIDNLPAHMILELIDFFAEKDKDIHKIAVAVDLRSGYFFEDIFHVLSNLEKNNISYKILFLESSKNVLIRRFSLTRRKHPLVIDGDLNAGIEEEIERTHELKEKADIVIDTTLLSPKELRIEITQQFMSDTEKKGLLQVNILSFGFKYGIPQNADIIMDVRFLPNPFYNDKLKDLTGESCEVINYVLTRQETKQFLTMFENMLDFLIPNYIQEGKSYLCIGIGCTGGKHRSVVISDKIFDYLKLKGISAKITHRDIIKD
jgi:RNase adapter protein RapZ